MAGLQEMDCAVITRVVRRERNPFWSPISFLEAKENGEVGEWSQAVGSDAIIIPGNGREMPGMPGQSPASVNTV